MVVALSACIDSHMSNSKSFSLKHVSKRALLGSFLVSALGHQVWAVEPFTLRDIRVEGLQRSEAGTVFGSLPFQVGDTYNDEKGAAAIRALFATGLFKDVRLEVEKDVLLVLIEERPLVAEVFFTGTKEFEPDVLKKALKDIGLYEGRPFDKALADKAEQELRRQYLNRSLYGAEVVATVTPLERNRVNVNFTVTEGDVAKITELRIVGAKAFPESELRDQLDLDTGNWMSWYTKSDRYSRAKLNADLETLRAYYLTRGYLEFKIEASQVSISPDKRTISILINITEGQRYAVTGVKLAGDYLGREEDFKSLVKIKVGESYNSQTLEETKKHLPINLVPMAMHSRVSMPRLSWIGSMAWSATPLWLSRVVAHMCVASILRAMSAHVMR
jgi:outer membrane protein insertion porin family